jgi:cell division protein FtsB
MQPQDRRVVIDDAYVTKKLCLLLEQVDQYERTIAKLQAENAELRAKTADETSAADETPAAETPPPAKRARRPRRAAS